MKSVRIWLWIGVVMVIIQVMLGGITRLTESGLSITEWDVVMGSKPPTTDAAWQAEFELYRKSAQFEKVNSDFTIEQFKSIYWWEFIHRLWARLIGFVFLFPFLFFLIKKKFNGSWIKKLLLIFVLGGLQGFVGWVMVASGLDGDPWVDPSKLTIHLMLALFVYMYLIWLALSYNQTPVTTNDSAAHRSIKWVLILILIQIALGGLMAGTDAGRIYNTYPLMNGRVMPEGAFSNLAEANKLVALTGEINFLHRTFAIIVALGIFYFWKNNRKNSNSTLNKLNNWLLIGLLLQFTLGVVTLLSSSIHIPVFLGVAHQITACLLLGVAVSIMYYAKPRAGFSPK